MNKSLVICLGNKDQIPMGQGMCFIIEDREIAVFRPRCGGIFAIENRCPHRQGPLSEGIVGAGKVVCPLHGHKFDLITGQGNESHECVKIFKVWEEHDQIMLECTISLDKKESKQSVVCTNIS